MFFFVSQIVLDAFPLQMCGQRPPSARTSLILIATAGPRREVVVLWGILLCFLCDLGKLGTEFLREQPQLIGAQLFAPRAAFGSEQLS